MPEASDHQARHSRDRVASVWDERTGFHGEGQWPRRVDRLVAEEPERWVAVLLRHLFERLCARYSGQPV
jgi:hypothetical protein